MTSRRCCSRRGAPESCRELRPLFAAHGIAGASISVEAGIAETPDEDALEVFGRSRKTRWRRRGTFMRAAGRPTFADDSGLAVDALGGASGRARANGGAAATDLAGQALDDENNRLLLERLRGVTDRRRVVTSVRRRIVDGRASSCRRGEVHGSIVDDRARDERVRVRSVFLFATSWVARLARRRVRTKERVSHRGAGVSRVRACRSVLERSGAGG